MSRKSYISSVEVAAVSATCALAAVSVALSGASPTAITWIDVLWCAALGAVVTLAGSKARRWSLFVLAGSAGALANSVSLVIAALALLMLVTATVLDRRDRIIGAVVAGLAVTALCWTEPTGPNGLNTLVGTIAVTCVLVSGYRTTHRRSRRVLRRVAATSAVVVGSAGLIGVLALLAARPGLENGVDNAEAGLAAARNGEIEEAGVQFNRAETTLDSRATLLNAMWVAPARAVPVVGQHVRTLAAMAESGAAVAGAAREVTAVANAEQLQISGGRIDLMAVADSQEPLAQSVNALTEAVDRLDQVDSPWLAWIVGDRIDSVEGRLVDALDSARTATLASRTAPGLLGADGPRRYLLLFTTPAETRGLGGFVGNWAVIEADDGKLDLIDTGRTTDLAEAPGALDRVLNAPADYAARYGNRYTPQVHVMNVTASPDFPSVAQVAADIYAQAGLGRIDGVIALDPSAVAGLVALNGAVQIPGLPAPLDATALEQFLLVDQYRLFPDREEREQVLDQLIRGTVDSFLTTARPGPQSIADAFGPAVANGGLHMWTPDAEEQRLFERLDLDGAFPTVEEAPDLLSVRTANASANKMDVYLQRSIDHRAEIDPATGVLRSTTSVTLLNDAPPDLPTFVLGNPSDDLPLGANRQWVSLYSPHSLAELRVNGVPVPAESLVELGWGVYSTLVVVPPNSTAEVSFDLVGDADPTDYELLWWSQPTVQPDDLVVEVHSGDEQLISFDGDGAEDRAFRSGETVRR